MIAKERNDIVILSEAKDLALNPCSISIESFRSGLFRTDGNQRVNFALRRSKMLRARSFASLRMMRLVHFPASEKGAHIPRPFHQRVI